MKEDKELAEQLFLTTIGKLFFLIETEEKKLLFFGCKIWRFFNFFLFARDNEVTLSVFIIIHREKPFSGEENCILLMH